MIDTEQLHQIRTELGIVFCSEHSLTMAALEKIVRIVERIICDKEMPEAIYRGEGAAPTVGAAPSPRIK